MSTQIDPIKRHKLYLGGPHMKKQEWQQAFTYSKANATTAQVTTIPSSMFQPSRRYDPGCKTIPKSRIYKTVK